MLAVAGGKGGCGKTTTTLGLAIAAGRRGHSVLAVDADVDVPDLHRVAGIGGSADRRPRAPDHGRAEEHQALEPRPVPGTAGVSVLPARPGMESGSLRDRIQGATADFDLVLLDCPAGGGRDAAIPLRVADRTLLVTTDRGPSLLDAAKTGAMARAVGTPVAGAVLTRTERVPDGAGSLLGTETIEAIPTAVAPLRDRTVTRRYRRILRRLTDV